MSLIVVLGVGVPLLAGVASGVALLVTGLMTKRRNVAIGGGITLAVCGTLAALATMAILGLVRRGVRDGRRGPTAPPTTATLAQPDIRTCTGVAPRGGNEHRISFRRDEADVCLIKLENTVFDADLRACFLPATWDEVKGHFAAPGAASRTWWTPPPDGACYRARRVDPAAGATYNSYIMHDQAKKAIYFVGIQTPIPAKPPPTTGGPSSTKNRDAPHFFTRVLAHDRQDAPSKHEKMGRVPIFARRS